MVEAWIAKVVIMIERMVAIIAIEARTRLRPAHPEPIPQTY